MFPPRKHLYPFAFIISYIKVVVVVLPSLPVTPIIVDGDICNTISISDVSIAPRFTSSCNSSLLGIQLGDLKIISNPFRFFKLSSPK